MECLGCVRFDQQGSGASWSSGGVNGQHEMHLQPTVTARHSPREPGDAHPDRIVHNFIGSDACAYTRQFQLSVSSYAHPISKVVDVLAVMHRLVPQVKTVEGLQVQVIDKTLPNTIGEADADIKWCGLLCGYSVSGGTGGRGSTMRTSSTPTSM